MDRKNIRCPNCGRKLKEAEYLLSIKSFFKFSVYCNKCGFKELKTGSSDIVLRFFNVRYRLPRWMKAGKYAIFEAICSGEIKENDIWREMPKNKVPYNLKKMVGEVERHLPVSHTIYRRKNKRFEDIFIPYLSIYPFFIYGEEFAICKIEDPLVDEILISKNDIIFVNYNYRGEGFVLEYSPRSKNFLNPDKGEMEGVDVTDTMRNLYRLLEEDRELHEDLMRYMKGRLYVATRKKALSFEDLREYLLRYKTEYTLAETEFIEKEKEVIVGVHIYNTLHKIKLRPEYFAISKRILQKVFSL